MILLTDAYVKSALPSATSLVQSELATHVTSKPAKLHAVTFFEQNFGTKKKNDCLYG